MIDKIIKFFLKINISLLLICHLKTLLYCGILSMTCLLGSLVELQYDAAVEEHEAEFPQPRLGQAQVEGRMEIANDDAAVDHDGANDNVLQQGPCGWRNHLSRKTQRFNMLRFVVYRTAQCTLLRMVRALKTETILSASQLGWHGIKKGQ